MFQLEFVARTFTDMMRALFFFIDGLIYKFIGILYNLLVQIANTTIFTDDIIDMFASKVYGLLGIFMLFKVSFSIMTYIVNPDEFSDKNKGFSKIISNIVITLTLLLFTPWLFSQAMDIQRIVLKDNIIGKIFSSADSNSFSGIMENVEITNAGSSMAYQTFKSFYHINYERFPDCKGIETNFAELNNNNNDQKCRSALGLSNSDYQKYKNYLTMAEATEDINRNRSYVLLNQEKDNDIFVEPYIMTYTPLVSTLVGGFMAWIFIIFCFDIAVRSVKLGFLRMIAPVPIISKIDPKGKGMFDKWVKVCVSTYLDLFIRLIAIFFSLFVVQQVFYMDFVNAATGLPETVSMWTKIFIVMGALLFAKQLPKLLQDLTGAKMDGKFTLNPLKKMSEVPILGKPMAAGTQFATRTAGNLLGAAGYMATKPLKNTMGKVGNSSFGRKVKGVGNKVSDGLKNAYNKADGFTGGRLENIANDFDSTIGGIGRSIEDDLGMFEKKDRFLSNREAQILNEQSAKKEVMQKNKTMTSAVDAVFDRAKKKVSESDEYAKRKANVERLKSLAESRTNSISELNKEKMISENSLSEYRRQFSDTNDNDIKTSLQQQIDIEQQKINNINAAITDAHLKLEQDYDSYAAAETAFNKWANKTGVFEYIDKNAANPGADPVLDGLIAKRDETARALSDAEHDYVSHFVGTSAKFNDDAAGIYKSENTKIESGFVKYEQELYEIKEQKRRLQESRRSVGDYRRIGSGPKNK